MKKEFSKLETKDEEGSIKSYILGFIFSILLTLLAYFLVTLQILAAWGLTAALAGLGIIQMCVQLLFFLHLGNESKPRWNFLSFLFMVLVVVILVFGSLWIMYSLDERLMPKNDQTELATRKNPNFQSYV